MKKIIFGLVVLASIVPTATASACSTKSAKDGGACTKDAICIVLCADGTKAGELTWNGSVWTDSQKSDADLQKAAKKVCDANGTACG